MVGLFENIGESFAYAFGNTVKRPGIWLGLILFAFLNLIVIAVGALCLLADDTLFKVIGIVLLVIGFLMALFFFGVGVQIYGNKPITFKNFFGTIGRGFQSVIISFIYMLVVAIVTTILSCIGVASLASRATEILTANIAGFDLTSILTFIQSIPTIFTGVSAAEIIALIVVIILDIFFSMLMYAALVNFARAGKFGAGFHFGEIFGRIRKVGWLKYLAAIILYAILLVILYIIIGAIIIAFTLIPTVILSVILIAVFTILVIPIMVILSTKLIANLFGE